MKVALSASTKDFFFLSHQSFPLPRVCGFSHAYFKFYFENDKVDLMIEKEKLKDYPLNNIQTKTNKYR